MTEERFDELLKEIREENPPAAQVTEACDRVWRQIAHSTSLACAEFRPEFGAYTAGHLTESRRLLIDDHLSRCAECRNVLAGNNDGAGVVSISKPRRAFKMAPWARWAVAAGVAAIALYMGRDAIDNALAPSGPRATVVSITGSLYQLAANNGLSAGATLTEKDVVRTGAGSRAILQLADGSRVELNQRTELFVRAAWSGQSIHLNHGDIVVEAAKQRRGRLRVVTRDSVASVKGTVFAVSSGTAGSLVSVVEGSVEVKQPGADKLLTAGKQAASNPALEDVPVRKAIAWSQDHEKYYTLLGELIGIEKELAKMPPQAMRTEARLLRYLPPNTVIYFAVPNLDGTIRQALRLVDNRAQQNDVLNEWWSSNHGQELRRMLDRLQAITPYLGDEVVFVLTRQDHTHSAFTPLLIAQIQPGRSDALRQGIERLTETAEHEIPYLITQDLLLVSEKSATLAAMSAQLGGGANTPFAAEIAGRYRNGVSWLVGIDVAATSPRVRDQNQGRMLGAFNVRHLFFEQRSAHGRDENEATLSFEGARTGIASWLAAPGASASGEYVSSEAVFAFSASTKDPRQALDELLASVGGMNEHLRRFEAETGVSLSNDIAASLGTDFTVAIERPSIPIPGWIGVFEAVRPSVLDDAIRRLVDAYNRKLSPDQATRKATLTQETVNGRTWMALSSPGIPATLYWSYDRGYLVMSTDRALAARAITIRDSSASLVRSTEFKERFPATGGAHHSGFIWLNTNGVVADVAALIENPAIRNLVGNREPLLVVIDGEMERIRAASRSRLTSLLLDAMLVQSVGEKKVGQPGETKKVLKPRV